MLHYRPWLSETRQKEKKLTIASFRRNNTAETCLHAYSENFYKSNTCIHLLSQPEVYITAPVNCWTMCNKLESLLMAQKGKPSEDLSNDGRVWWSPPMKMNRL